MQFRLRTLLIMIGIGCLALGVAADRGYRQQRAVEAIIARSGRVDYTANASWYAHRQSWLGRDFFEAVSMVFWAGAPIADDDLVYLRALPRLHTLTLTSTAITDAGLQHLEGLRDAKMIDLRFTHVTDEGANRLRIKLPHAKILLHSDVD